MTLNDESEEEEAPEEEKLLAFVAPHVEEEDSYSEHSDDGEELRRPIKLSIYSLKSRGKDASSTFMI